MNKYKSIPMLAAALALSAACTRHEEVKTPVSPVVGAAESPPAVSPGRKELLKSARLKPYVVDGKSQGYVIEHLDPGSAWEKAGLKEGDIITKAQGETIHPEADSMQWLAAITDSMAGPLEVLRPVPGSATPQRLLVQDPSVGS